MIRKYLLPALAALGLLFAIRTVLSGNKQPPTPQPVAAPSLSPFAKSIAGSGIIEASSENIAVGSQLSGTVKAVHVTPGASVAAGQPLFELDDRDVAARLAIQQSAVTLAEQQFLRAKSLPRPEEIPMAKARVAEAIANLAEARAEFERRVKIADTRAVSAAELGQRKAAADVAAARVDATKSDLALLMAGSWKEDLAILQAQLDAARVGADALTIERDRLIVRAPVSSTVLQVKVRVGEFAQAGVMQTPLMILGNTETLHVRVDIDENDAWRLPFYQSSTAYPTATSQPHARAFLRGNSEIFVDLEYVRTEPYVIPKRSLTGESSERVDTRVLQVLFRYRRDNFKAYVGQLVDVYIEEAVASAADSNASVPIDSPPAPGADPGKL